MAVSCIVYDLDGTLIDSAPDIQAAVNRVRAGYDLEPVPLEHIKAFIGDGAKRLLERAVLGLVEDRSLRPPRCLPRTYTDMGELLFKFEGEYSMDPVVETRLYKGVQEALVHWNSLGVAQVVLTNKPHHVAVRVMKDLGVSSLVDLIVGRGATDDQGQAVPPKPDPACIDYILDETGAPRDEVWMVGDGLPDIETAKAADIPIVVILGGYADPEALVANAPNLDRCVTDFAAADALLRANL